MNTEISAGQTYRIVNGPSGTIKIVRSSISLGDEMKGEPPVSSGWICIIKFDDSDPIERNVPELVIRRDCELIEES